MKFKSLEIIKALEKQIDTGYSLKIFRGYIAINKRGVEKLINELYANLPNDVKAAREFLETKSPKDVKVAEENSKTQNKNTGNTPALFDNIKEFETKLECPLQFASHVIVNVNEIEKLINKIYCSLPEEIQEANILSKQ